MFELFGIGKSWAGAFKTDPLQSRPGTVVADGPINAPTLKLSSSGPSAADAARDRFRDASGALKAAFGGFARETNPVYGTTLSSGKSGIGMASGTSARVDPIDVDYYSLHTTNEVNTQTSTVRTSSSAIGLDVTSAQTASRLNSSAGLGLDVVGASSVKVSKEEMNTGLATSYGSGSLTFSSGGSTSASIGSLTGTYTGTGKAADATALTVTVTRGGEIKSSFLGLGQTRIDFEVRDQTGELIKSYSGDLEAGETVSLGGDIGLSLSFGAGMLTTGHTSTFAVSKTPITVDANAHFNAAPGVRPQFEAVSFVKAGSFKVNDTTIQVFADDTINTVLQRITNSAAGVTATLSGDKVTLTSKTNSDADISVGSDNSDFVKAVRLDGASTAKGNLADTDRLLKDTVVFDHVVTGSFTINGQTISVNEDTDTIGTVLARINASGASVTASLNTTTNKIEIVTTGNSEDLITVGSDTTGFLGMAKLTASTVGNISDDVQVLKKTTQFGSVASGSFMVNGVSIAVDKNNDSLSSIISRINSSGAGVTASYNAQTDRLTLTPNVAGATLSLEGDNTGFLAAAKVASGTVGTRANASAAFNGTGLNSPLFDPGQSVHAGSFTVNGVAISVAANDSINSVLAKITGSNAGVTATYDSATERVRLTSTHGDTPITLGADTSGFLAAVKLNGTTTTVSTVSYSSLGAALGTMTEYSGVRAGTLTVNGQNIAIDPATTTITSLVNTLNGLNGIGASINQSNGGISVWSETGGAVALSDTSGVLAALGISTGTYAGTTGSSIKTTKLTGHSTTSNSIDVAEKAATAVAELNEALDGLGGDRLRNTLESAIDRLRDHGIRGLSVTSEGDEVTLEIASDELVNALNLIGDDVDLERELGEFFLEFDEDVTAAAGWNAPPPTAQAVRLDTSLAQLSAAQTATSLLYLRSSLQPQVSTENTQKAAMKAYGETS